jgi:ribosomal protein S18 acetylase RimI-like enzyme
MMKTDGLYQIKKNAADREKLVATFLDAFREYPKLMGSFPGERERLAALEATLRYYCAFDLRYGRGYALDPDINEAVLVLDSEAVRYTYFRHLLAGSYNRGYRAAMRHLTKTEQRKRIRLFEELDILEKTVDIPSPHVYVDFLGVRKACQHTGRGRKLMDAVLTDAAENRRPVMLFTNTPEDVMFYRSIGFQTIGTVKSNAFQFTSTYLLK